MSRKNWKIGKMTKKVGKRSGKNAIKLDALMSLCLHHIHKNGFSLFVSPIFYSPCLQPIIRWFSTTICLLPTKMFPFFVDSHQITYKAHTQTHTHTYDILSCCQNKSAIYS